MPNFIHQVREDCKKAMLRRVKSLKVETVSHEIPDIQEILGERFKGFSVDVNSIKSVSNRKLPEQNLHIIALSFVNAGLRILNETRNDTEKIKSTKLMVRTEETEPGK